MGRTPGAKNKVPPPKNQQRARCWKCSRRLLVVKMHIIKKAQGYDGPRYHCSDCFTGKI